MKKIGTWVRGSNGAITVKVPKWSIKDARGKTIEWTGVYGGHGSSHMFELRDVEVDLLSEFGDHVKLIQKTRMSGDIMELK